MTNSFCIIWPRKRLTEFTNVSGSIWSTPFSSAKISAVYDDYNTKLSEASSAALSDGNWYHDGETFYFLNGTDPDSFDFPGVTVEFPLYFSNVDVTTYSNPLDSSSEIVDWNGVLVDIPSVQNGFRETLLGVSPLLLGTIRVLNGDRYLNEFLHDCSFNRAICKAWNGSRQVFLGYTKGFSIDENEIISFKTTDFFGFFDRKYDLNFSGTDYFGLSEFPNLEPEAWAPGVIPWKKRLVFGMVDGHRAVNIDYNATPAVTNNRDWVTQRYISGNSMGDTLEDLDHTASNTTTRTYFENTPLVNVGDWVILTHNGTDYITEVEVVNRSLKYIEHEPLVGRTFTANDLCARKFVARVVIQDENGSLWFLEPGVHYDTFLDGTKHVAGFTLADDFETALGFTPGTFDPDSHTLLVRVYGDKDLDQYSDSTDVGEIVDNGGNRAQAIQHLFRTIKDAGFPISDIDKTTFADVGGDSHSFGYAIPAAYNDSETQTYRAIIEQICADMLWSLGFQEDSSDNSLKLGLFAYRPFESAGDYDVDDQEFRNVNFSVDYDDVYSDFELLYFTREVQIDVSDYHSAIVSAVSLPAYNLHFENKKFAKTSMHYDSVESQEHVDRLSYALGERRGLYNLILGSEYLNYVNLGVSYNILRESLPGFTYTPNTEQTRQTRLIEVNKSTESVLVTLDDQKGIQDNSGVW